MTKKKVTNPEMITIILGLNILMVSMDAFILNTAIPSIASYFYIDPLDLKISLIIYLLCLSLMLPLNGWLIEKYGARKSFYVSLGIFSLSSLGCGLSTSFSQFIVCRGFQGIGGAFALSLARFSIMHFFPREDYVKQMSQIGVITSFSGLLGPVIGGIIVTHFAWQWIFWINLPIAIVLISFALKYLPTNHPKEVQAPDGLSYVYFTLGSTLCIYSLSMFSNLDHHQKLNYLYLFIGIFMFVLYYRRSKKIKKNVLDSDLFKINSCKVGIKAGVYIRILLGSLPFILPLLFQTIFYFSPEKSGFLILPMALGTLSIRFVITKVLKTYGYQKSLIVSTVILFLLLFAYAFIDVHTPISLLIGTNFLLGGLISFLYSATNYLAQEDVPKNKAASLVNITSIIHYTINSVGIAFAVLLLRLFSNGRPELATFHFLFMTLSGLLLFSLVNYKIKS